MLAERYGVEVEYEQESPQAAAGARRGPPLRVAAGRRPGASTSATCGERGARARVPRGAAALGGDGPEFRLGFAPPGGPVLLARRRAIARRSSSTPGSPSRRARGDRPLPGADVPAVRAGAGPGLRRPRGRRAAGREVHQLRERRLQEETACLRPDLARARDPRRERSWSQGYRTSSRCTRRAATTRSPDGHRADRGAGRELGRLAASSCWPSTPTPRGRKATLRGLRRGGAARVRRAHRPAAAGPGPGRPGSRVPGAVEAALARTRRVLEFELDLVLQRVGQDDPDAVYRDARDALAQVPESILRQEQVRRVAGALRLDERLTAGLVRRAAPRPDSGQRSPTACRSTSRSGRGESCSPRRSRRRRKAGRWLRRRAATATAVAGRALPSCRGSAPRASPGPTRRRRTRGTRRTRRSSRRLPALQGRGPSSRAAAEHLARGRTPRTQAGFPSSKRPRRTNTPGKPSAPLVELERRIADPQGASRAD